MVGDEWGRKDPRLMVELEGNHRGDRIQVTRGRQNEILGGSAALYRSRMGQSFRNRREGGETLVDLQKYMGSPGGSDSKESSHNAGDLGLEDLSEKGMATRYSSIFAWRSPWTEEPGGLLSMGSQRFSLCETGDFIRSC